LKLGYRMQVAVSKWPQSLVPLGPNIAGSISACSKMTLVINNYGTDWAVPWWTQPLTPSGMT